MDIEKICSEKLNKITPPKDLKERVAASVERQLKLKTRQDDLKLIAFCLVSLVLLVAIFVGMAMFQKHKFENMIAETSQTTGSQISLSTHSESLGK